VKTCFCDYCGEEVEPEVRVFEWGELFIEYFYPKCGRLLDERIVRKPFRRF